MKQLSFPREPEKELAATLWVASQRERVDMYNLIKTIYDANINHLNKYGRPVIGGLHSALPFGPIHSDVYNLLQTDTTHFSLVKNPAGKECDVVTTFKPDLEELSESDQEALKEAWEKNKDKTFNEVHDYYAKDPAYQAVWRQRAGGINSIPIPYKEMLTDDQTAISKENIAVYLNF